MKYALFLSIISISLFISCNNENMARLKNENDSLKKELAHSYKPGFGEFMSGVQVHHAKLWFAGINKNWELADFEVHEIMEAIDGIKEFQSERPESKRLSILDAALDSVNHSISKRDPVAFKTSFEFLSNSCNTCHKEVNYQFNKVKIPDSPPFSNQEFKLK